MCSQSKRSCKRQQFYNDIHAAVVQLASPSVFIGISDARCFKQFVVMSSSTFIIQFKNVSFLTSHILIMNLKVPMRLLLTVPFSKCINPK